MQGPVVQSIISLTSSLRVISLTVLADSIHNILIFFAEKMWVAFAVQCKSYSHFFSKKFQHICISLDVNFNKSWTNDVVSFEQLGPKVQMMLCTCGGWSESAYFADIWGTILFDAADIMIKGAISVMNCNERKCAFRCECSKDLDQRLSIEHSVESLIRLHGLI